MISTKRILLKSLSFEDAKELFFYRALPEVYKFQCWLPKNISDAEEFIKTYSITYKIAEGRWTQFGIYLLKGNFLVGDCGFCLQSDKQAEIGYTISPPFQRQGIGKEAVESLIGFLFREVSIKKIIAKTDPENKGSIKLLQCLGFWKEAHLERSVKIRGEWKDDVVYSILKEEYT
jgi:RimJ/RimL family protein N-acetyltransferase